MGDVFDVVSQYLVDAIDWHGPNGLKLDEKTAHFDERVSVQQAATLMTEHV